MHKFDRYIFRQLGITLTLITTAMVFVIWLSRSLKFIDYIVNRGVSLGTFGKLTLLLMPNLLYIILPITLFTAVMFVYNRLHQDSELVVSYAAGLSPSRVARPALLLATLVMMLSYLFSLYLIPTSYRAFKDLQSHIRSDFSITLLEEGVFTEVSKNVTVYVRERMDNGELKGLLVYDTTNPDQPITIIAQSGTLVSTPDGPRVIVVKGHRQEQRKDTKKTNLLYFDEYTLDLNQTTEEGGSRWHEPRERFLKQLLWPENSTNDIKNRLQLIAKGHSRIITPLYNISFALVALFALLLSQFSRRGQARRIALAVVLMVLWQAGALSAENISIKNNAFIPLMYLVWLIPTAYLARRLLLNRTGTPWLVKRLFTFFQPQRI